MLATDDIIAICFGLTSVLLAVLSLYVTCKPKAAPGLDLESGPRTTSLPSNRAPSISAYSSIPSRAQISLHGDAHNHLRSIRPTPQRATNQFRDFAKFIPAMTFATVDPPSESAIELYQVMQSTRFLSYNRSWGWYLREGGPSNGGWIV
ncbi:hypothetical protein BPAE_0329g00030 [Botrytis paeoniae]|uniref:Uncharacterized protein n=1 Tax=Botrytis paeoniae TaxID=278948 RepID=A0A4Z1FAP4_9HELO|nr:hypothetical protein BPAE_0329g00030 [Botrytis paeoniae]